MQSRAVLAVIVLTLAGCTSSSEKVLQGTAEVPTWASLAELTDEPLRQVSKPASVGNWTAVKSTLARDSSFANALDKFEKEPIPRKFSTPAREAARTDLINHFKALIEGVKSGAAPTELKEHFDAGQKALGTLTYTEPPPTK
jgi:hypothetical protein